MVCPWPEGYATVHNGIATVAVTCLFTGPISPVMSGDEEGRAWGRQPLLSASPAVSTSCVVDQLLAPRWSRTDGRMRRVRVDHGEDIGLEPATEGSAWPRGASSVGGPTIADMARGHREVRMDTVRLPGLAEHRSRLDVPLCSVSTMGGAQSHGLVAGVSRPPMDIVRRVCVPNLRARWRSARVPTIARDTRIRPLPSVVTQPMCGAMLTALDVHDRILDDMADRAARSPRAGRKERRDPLSRFLAIRLGRTIEIVAEDRAMTARLRILLRAGRIEDYNAALCALIECDP